METGSEKTRPERQKSEMHAKPQTEVTHPDEWERDLNPDRMAGQNIGETGPAADRARPSAHDLKDVHRSLSGEFRDDELKAIPVLGDGERLKQGAKYMDLRDPERKEFTATGEMSAERGARLVPKDEVPYSVWNRLSGVESPERIAERGGEG